MDFDFADDYIDDDEYFPGSNLSLMESKDRGPTLDEGGFQTWVEGGDRPFIPDNMTQDNCDETQVRDGFETLRTLWKYLLANVNGECANVKMNEIQLRWLRSRPWHLAMIKAVSYVKSDWAQMRMLPECGRDQGQYVGVLFKQIKQNVNGLICGCGGSDLGLSYVK